MSAEKVLVTGATGFLGNALVRRLVEEGNNVVALVRDREKGVRRLPPGTEILLGDVTRADLLPSLPPGVRVVIHTVGMLGAFRVPESSYRLVNATGTENMLKASVAAGIEQFVLISSAGVLGPTGERLADETWPLNPSNGYERSKAEAERIATEFHRDGRIAVSIVRPEFVYGPGDHHVLGLFRAIQDRRFVLIGSGASLLHPTYIDDVTQSVLSVLGGNAYDGMPLLVAGPRPVTVRELAETIAESIGVHFRLVRLPRSVAFGGATLCEVLGRVLGRDMPLTFSRVRFFTENRAFTTDRAEAVLRYKPCFSLQEGVSRTVEWYRKEGLLG